MVCCFINGSAFGAALLSACSFVKGLILMPGVCDDRDCKYPLCTGWVVYLESKSSALRG